MHEPSKSYISRAEIVKVYSDLFAKPCFHVDLLELLIQENKVCAELIVRIDGHMIKVVDILEYDEFGLLVSIKAFF